MKYSMRYLLIGLFSVMFLAACNSSPVKSEGNNITSISINGYGRAGPNQTSFFASVNKNLSFISRRSSSGELKKKITQAQFDDVVASLKKVDFSKLKSTVLPEGILGGSTSTISIVTDQKTYSYSNGYKSKSPKAVSQAMVKLWKLAPKK